MLCPSPGGQGLDMDSYDQSKGSQSLNDVIYRRLKNRERQRRYRERKRLQVESGNASVTNQSSQLQIVPLPLPTNGTVEQVLTRAHCARDWKKDARRVHIAKQEIICNSLSSNGQPSASEELPSAIQDAEQTLKSETPPTNGSGVDDHEKVRSKRGRRDWKSEARNKNTRHG